MLSSVVSSSRTAPLLILSQVLWTVDHPFSTMSSKQQLPATVPSRPQSLRFPSAAQSGFANSLSSSERRDRVQAFHDALRSDSIGFLTLPEYSSTRLSPDQTLSLILQYACSTANSLVDKLPDDDEDEEGEQER